MNTLLMILDGFGKSTQGGCTNAIAMANKPHLDLLFSSCPNTVIGASGTAVGLPDGQMGNSEVGHLNIGAGRIVYQELSRISKEIEEGEFYDNSELDTAVRHALSRGSSLHIMGLLSDGGVHSHLSHLFALLELAGRKGLDRVFIHAFLDGRDVPPRSAKTYLNQLTIFMEQRGIGRIASVSGRYYAMDRDRRWERTKSAYDALTMGVGRYASSAEDAVNIAYAAGENDEFVKPTIIKDGSFPVSTVEDNDSVIFFNFRPDRARQLTRCFTDDGFNGFERDRRPSGLCFVCMTQYDAEMPNVLVAYPPQSLKNTFGEYVSSLGFRQLRIAETEKYAHVTFFFNGGVEAPNNGEDRLLIPSPGSNLYLNPFECYKYGPGSFHDRREEIRFYLISQTGHGRRRYGRRSFCHSSLICVDRIIRAETFEDQLILTSDHGNDCVCNADGSIVTATLLTRAISCYDKCSLVKRAGSLRTGSHRCDLIACLEILVTALLCSPLIDPNLAMTPAL